MPLWAEQRDISRAAEDKLAYKLGVVANERCRPLLDAYNACNTGRTISTVWACRAAYQASHACVIKYVNERSVEVMKERWLEAGRPRYPDWGALMDGLIPPPEPGEAGGGSVADEAASTPGSGEGAAGSRR